MTEQDTSNEGGNNTGGSTPSTGDEFKAITSQEELNAVLKDRLERERAKFSDYKDLKSKAAQLDSLAEASKTEAEKFNERIAALEKANGDLATSALRARIQAKFSISDEDAELFLTGADEDSLTKQAQRLAQRESERKKQGNRVFIEGTNPAANGSEDATFASNLLGG